MWDKVLRVCVEYGYPTVPPLCLLSKWIPSPPHGMLSNHQCDSDYPFIPRCLKWEESNTAYLVLRRKAQGSSLQGAEHTSSLLDWPAHCLHSGWSNDGGEPWGDGGSGWTAAFLPQRERRHQVPLSAKPLSLATKKPRQPLAIAASIGKQERQTSLDTSSDPCEHHIHRSLWGPALHAADQDGEMWTLWLEGGDTDDNSAAGFLLRKFPEDRLWRPTQRNPVTDKRKMRADPLALQVSEFPDGQSCQGGRDGEMGWGCGSAPAEMQGVQRWGGVEVMAQASDSHPSRDHTLKAASCIQHLPSLPPDTTGCSQKSTLIWWIITAPNTCQRAFKEDSTRNGTCIPAMELSEPWVGDSSSWSLSPTSPFPPWLHCCLAHPLWCHPQGLYQEVTCSEEEGELPAM